MKKLLNVGSGPPGTELPYFLENENQQEIRLDVEEKNQPDILGSMLDMSEVGAQTIDIIYSSHNIEHLYPGEVPIALKEFKRVLKPDGFIVITCPDLQEAAKMIAEDKLLDTAYESPGGPVTPFDIIYSHRMFTRRDNPFMAHHCGFTLSVLMGTIKSNGFQSVIGKKGDGSFDLWVCATITEQPEDKLKELGTNYLPIGVNQLFFI